MAKAKVIVDVAPLNLNTVVAPDAKEEKLAKLIFVHQAILWPSICSAEKTLSKAKIKLLDKMVKVDGGFYLHARGQQAWIPDTQVICAIME